MIDANFVKNIARGTTDPGYWVYNSNKFSDWNQFDIILAEKEEKGILNSDIFILVTIEKAKTNVSHKLSISINYLWSTNVAHPSLHPTLVNPCKFIWMKIAYISLLLSLLCINVNEKLYLLHQKSSSPPSDNPSERCFCGRASHFIFIQQWLHQ